MATGGHSVRITSEEAFDYICSVCDRQSKTKEAVKYCLECKDYCCKSCTDSHNVFSGLIGHTLLDIGQGNQRGSKIIHFPTERCCKHEGKILDMYCESHDEVVCYTCVANDHKSCSESKIYSVPDMLSTLSKFSDSRQTQRHLRQMIDSMTKLRESKDDRLETLNEARKKALDQVTKFQNALEIIFRKAADVSRNEIEEGYKKLKTEILQDKSNIDDANKVLLKDNNKIDRAASNEAQRFVCSKIAEKSISIKLASDVMIKKEKINNTGLVLSFFPNKPLTEYVQSLNGIGEVLVGTKEKAQVSTKMKQGLYKLIKCRDMNIKVPGDSSACSSYGSCLINEHHLLVTDRNNKKLKRFDVNTLTLIDSCTLNSKPYGVCSISIDTVAVACQYLHRVQFVSIKDKMVPTKSFDTDHYCYGIAVKDDKLYVTTYSTNKPVYVYNMTGTLLKTIDVPGNKSSTYTHIKFNESGDKMFVTDRNNMELKRFDVKTLTLIDSCSLNRHPYGVCSISIDTVAVACQFPNKVQFVSIQDKMVPTKSFKTDHGCYGIVVKDDKLYVTTYSTNELVYVYNMTGTLLKTIDVPGKKSHVYTHITFNKSGAKMFVGDFYKGLICFDGKDNYLSTITDSDLSGVEGVCTDTGGNVFVVGQQSNTVVQFNEDGTKIGVVLKGKDGLRAPRSVVFHQGLNRLFVTMFYSNVLKEYELE